MSPGYWVEQDPKDYKRMVKMCFHGLEADPGWGPGVAGWVGRSCDYETMYVSVVSHF